MFANRTSGSATSHPSKTFRLSVVREAPGAAALSFRRTWHSILRLFGWDSKNNRPLTQGGIFGIPEAYSVAFEEQARGSLHLHALLWIGGWAQRFETLFELAGQREDAACAVVFEELKTSVLKSLDGFIKSDLSLPEPEFASSMSCPQIDCKGTQLVACPESYRSLMRFALWFVFRGSFGLFTSFRCRSNKDQSDPHMLMCPNCKKGVGPAALLQGAVQSGMRRIGRSFTWGQDDIASLKWEIQQQR